MLAEGKYIIRQRRISYRVSDISLKVAANYDMIVLKGSENMPRFSMTKQKFINQWLRHFAQGINKDQYEKYVKDQYIWHVFSWELIKPDGLLIGDAARQAFDETAKTDCIFCDMFGNGGVTDKLSHQYDTAEQIDKNLTEFYIVAKDFSWTYIKTHEGDFCGPYFLRIAE